MASSHLESKEGFTPVALSKIHQEHCLKEIKSQVLRTEFTLNPQKRGGFVTNKANERDPTYPPKAYGGSCLGVTGSSVLRTPRSRPTQGADAATAQGHDERTVEHFLSILERPRQKPKDKFHEPQTSAMTIGWDSETRKNEELSQREGKFSARWGRPRRNTEMSEYCERYLEMYGTSPFAV